MQPHVLLISTPAVVHFVTLLALEMKLLLVDEFFVNLATIENSTFNKNFIHNKNILILLIQKQNGFASRATSTWFQNIYYIFHKLAYTTEAQESKTRSTHVTQGI